MFDHLTHFSILLQTLMTFEASYQFLQHVDHSIDHKDLEYSQLYWNITPKDTESIIQIKSLLKKNNISCAGLINLIRMIIVKTPIPVSLGCFGHKYRGLKGWMAFFRKYNFLRPSYTYSELQVGDLLIRQNNDFDSGHMAIIYKIDKPANDPSDFTLVHANITLPSANNQTLTFANNQQNGIKSINWSDHIDEENRNLHPLLDFIKQHESQSCPHLKELVQNFRNKISLFNPQKNAFHHSVSISNWLNPYLI